MFLEELGNKELVMSRSWMVLCLSLLFLCPTSYGPAAADSPELRAPREGGAVVEEVEEGFAAYSVGLEPGDVLLRWQRAATPPANPQPASGVIDSPFDLFEIEIEQAPRGDLTVSGTRGGEPLQVRLPPGASGMETRPLLAGSKLDGYLEARDLIARGEIDQGLSRWQAMASALGDGGDHVQASWLFLRIASVASESRDWEIAERAFEAARREARASGEGPVLSLITDSLAGSFEDRNEFERASAAYHEALEIRQASSSTSLGVAKNLKDLGVVAWRRGDLVSAEDCFRRSLAIVEKLAPQSLIVAGCFNGLGNVAKARGELAKAEDYYRRALAIREELTPQSLEVSHSLNNLGNLAWKRGDLAAAEDYNRRALTIRKKLAPQGLGVAASSINLGNVAWSHGDLAAAEGYYRRALTIRERHAPQGLGVATSLNNLGIVATQRGDLALAEDYYRRALTIREKLAPQSVDVALCLDNLGSVAWYRGDLAAAEAYDRRALAIRQEVAPQSLNVAASLNNLGTVVKARGELAAAEDYFRRSLSLREKLAPQSLVVAHSLGNLGELASDREDFVTAKGHLGSALTILEKLAPRSVDAAKTLRLLGDVASASSDFDSAEAQYRRSFAIRRERAPGSADEAESCQRLAALHRRRGQLDQALAFYDCAVAALETQRGKLGGSDSVRSRFGATVAGTYREAIDLLVEVGQTEGAFHLLERYRARELLDLLAERDLVFSSDLPEELESRRRAANLSYDRAFGQWMHLSDTAGVEERQQAREELETARRLQGEIRAEIRGASPRLAALENPQPLDLGATDEALDPGTLLLSYLIGEEKSHLFAVGPGKGSHLWVLPVAAGQASLRGEVERLREAIGRGRSDRRPEKVLLHARRLSELLLAPVAARIGQAERLLILADGPLHSLPFAALTDPGAIGGRRFLVESKPIHLAASATVFALLKKERREGRPIRLTAFGDPQYPVNAPRGQEAAPQVRVALRSGFDLTPLPATRGEVESLRRLYPQASRVYLGAEATEGRAKAVGEETTHLHIASHGLLDDRFPLDSALAFSIPPDWQEGEDNGLLQAWEIFEQVRIDADLVTLSACDTGLGKIFGGEGLQGLTRAFQYAGARSVFASLWSVSDHSTGELMKRFYGYLKAGQSKADALRNAQLDLLRDPELSHPFHWAGFELVGDWR